MGAMIGLVPATADAAVAAGRGIEVFYGRDFVGIVGYPANTPVKVEVYRGTERIGIAEYPTDSTGFLEINHTGEGDCWQGEFTPNIEPGDEVRATVAGQTPDSTITRNVWLDEAATVYNENAGTITVKGRALSMPPGAPIAPGSDVLEVRMNVDGTWSTTGRKDLRADVGASVDGNGNFSYTFTGLTATDVQNGRTSEKAIEWSPGGETEPIPEITVFDGTEGPFGSCPPLLPDDRIAPNDPTGLVYTTSPGPSGSTFVGLNWTAATDNQGGSGIASYRVYMDGGTTPVGTVSAPTTSFDIRVTSLPRTFRVTAVDAAGNQSSPGVTTTVQAGASDTTAPTVTSTVPLANATTAAVDGNVTATFSEDVQGVSGSTFTLRPAAAGAAAVTATVSYNATTRTASLDPSANLTAGTQYTATLTGGSTAIRDTANNPLATTSWNFSTASAPPPADTTAPTVTSTSPVANVTNAAVDGNVTATFSEDVQGVNGSSFTLRPAAAGAAAVTATVSYNATTRTASLDPSANLTAGTQYTATLTGGSTAIRDTANNPLATTSWNFSTASAPPPSDGTAPTVTATTPAANATGFSVGNNITVAFSETVQNVSTSTFTLTDPAGVPVAGAVSFNTSTGRWVFNPSANLQNNAKYTATLTGGATAIRDLANNPLATTSWSFTTARGTDTVVPTVSSRSPAVNGTNVAVSSNVTATFSEAVQGVSGTTVTLSGPSGPVGATVGYNSTTRVATLDPTADLAAGATYTATLTGGATAIRDMSNNPLATTSWSFTTTGGTTTPGDTTAPTLSSRSPAVNGTNVAISSDVTATFNEAVQGVDGTTFTLRGPSGAVAGTVGYNSTTRVATLDPTADLAAGATYTATLTGGSTAIRDTAGNPLATTSWSFTTASATTGTDTTRPTVGSRSPAGGSTGVSRTSVVVTGVMSEQVTGITTTSVVLRPTGTVNNVATTITYDSATRKVTLDPTVTLAANAKYTVVFNPSASPTIKDVAGNVMAQTSWAFTTGP